MPGSRIGVELVRVVVPLEDGGKLRRLRRCRHLVLLAEEPEEGARQPVGEVDAGLEVDRNARRRGIDHAGAVAVHRCVQRKAARGQKALASPRAVADGADLAVGVGQGAEVGHRPRRIPEELFVGNPARGPGCRRSVVGARVRSPPVVEVRADRRAAVDGKLPGDLLGSFVPTGAMVDDHNAGDGARAKRPGEVGVDRVAVVPGYADCLCQRSVVHRFPPKGWSRAQAVNAAC